ncbi:hypothetical protein AURANDRAFT_31902 [Aureococcus anophagefferens]|uniref:Uncharacterized protein n=1 Tax=Aureococcus anophagefferens TaxID=44056 RepID=F0YJ74_AURAN|nr:hypothetical protein AURANDRAFT_31902 [Aureococcus anophagefferens]EGB04884.1 hypothetical protein AURANDRAFT_31902 [Aureococcus anophagefferens]|eukprot:XP_009040440.1 hypothetical protein AURANDRAFT_31902 [Aureococcus anophagefferens]
MYGLVKSDKKAAKIWKRAVELGDVDAMVFLGEMYLYGEGVKLDKKKAERLFRMAADRGDADAQNDLGNLLRPEKKYEEAFRYYALAADQGYTEGELNLGICYHYGKGTEVDLGKARYWFERAAAKGDEDARKKLARLDRRARFLLDSEEKFEEAVRYYALSANQGYTYAENSLGCCYMDGAGTEVDLGKARYWFERAAAKGHENAIQNLARLDARKAAKIYRRAVELGDVRAMTRLGGLYRTGSGVKLDKKKAERLYRTAADRGDAFGQTNLGTSLYSEEKFEEAFRYYALAADQGLTSGEFCLGCCYKDGAGTEVDLGKARYWFERAAAKGYEDAIRNLARLDAQV